MKWLAVVVACVGCAPDESGLVLTANPAGIAVGDADQLEVYVGYGERVQARRAGVPIQRHADDGLMKRFDIGSFPGPIDILLTGDGSRGPFWLAVRALHGGALVGEGGFPTTLAIPQDHVDSAVVDVHDGTFETNPNCPGFAGSDGAPHYIVPTDPAATNCDDDPDVEQDDCDDFDATIYTGAVDALCDGIDRDCAANPPIQGVPCIGGGAGTTCLIGTTDCDEETGAPRSCVLDPGGDSRVPDAACACSDLIGKQVVECLRDHANEVRCDIEVLSISPIRFCPSNTPLVSQDLWFHDTGTAASTGGRAEWWALPQQPTYGWVDGNRLFSAVFTSGAWPPSPALSLEGGAPANLDGRHDEVMFVYLSPAGAVGLDLVEVRYELATTCDNEPDCDLAFPP